MDNVMRYMLFFGVSYYPKGGMLDYRGTYSSIEEAQAEFKTRKAEVEGQYSEEPTWAQIVDKLTMQIVLEFGVNYDNVGEGFAADWRSSDA